MAHAAFTDTANHYPLHTSFFKTFFRTLFSSAHQPCGRLTLQYTDAVVVATSSIVTFMLLQLHFFKCKHEEYGT